MIHKLVYVACDLCGDPAGDSNCMADDAAEARSLACGVGFVRVENNGRAQRQTQMIDVCHRCAEGVAQ